MKLTPTPIEIEEFEGFTPEKDIFQRKQYAEQLTNIVSNVNDELVVAIDAPWGEGKSTFVRMWRGLLKQNSIESIYFDAYKNDFIEDPFLALIGEIYSLLNSNENTKVKKEFKEQAISAIKTIGKAGVRIGIRAATAGVLDETVLEGAGAGDELAAISDKYISERLESLEEDKASIEAFKSVLAKAANELGGENKLIFVIDELDRCKPSFALEILEKIKHIFSIPGIVFILVMNREQMNEIIKSRYGIGIDSTKYLQKFVHIWTGLPKSNEQHTSDIKKYLNDCLARMDFELKTRSQQSGIELYVELLSHYNASLREIERSLTHFAIIHNMTDSNINADYMWLSIYLSITKVLFPSSYKKLANGNTTYEEILTETKLSSLEDEYWGKGKAEPHPIRWLIRYYLSDDEQVKELLAQGNHSESRGFGRTAIKDICGWIETFNR